MQENKLTQVLTANLISSIISLPTTLASSVLQQHINSALVKSKSGNKSLYIYRGESRKRKLTINKLFFFLDNFGTSQQMDGSGTMSSSDESEVSDDNMEDEDNEDAEKEEEEERENDDGPEEEPLNSEDDVTDEDATDLFDTENVIVCQYDKVYI